MRTDLHLLLASSPEKGVDVFLEEITPSPEKSVREDVPYPLNASVELSTATDPYTLHQIREDRVDMEAMKS